MPTKVTTVTPEYKAWDYETLAKPLEQMTEYYDTVDTAQRNIGAEAAKLSDYINPLTDPTLVSNYQRFMSALGDARDDLRTTGGLRKGVKAIGDLQQRYAAEVAPIQKAHDFKDELTKEYDKVYDKTDGTAIFQYDPHYLSLEQIVNSNYSIAPPKWYSGDKLLKEMSDLAGRLRNIDFGAGLPDETAWQGFLYDSFGPMYKQAMSHLGLSMNDFFAKDADGNLVAAPTNVLFNALAKVKLASTGILDWLDLSTESGRRQLSRAYDIMFEGFFGALGSDTRVQVGDKSRDFLEWLAKEEIRNAAGSDGSGGGGGGSGSDRKSGNLKYYEKLIENFDKQLGEVDKRVRDSFVLVREEDKRNVSSDDVKEYYVGLKDTVDKAIKMVREDPDALKPKAGADSAAKGGLTYDDVNMIYRSFYPTDWSADDVEALEKLKEKIVPLTGEMEVNTYKFNGAKKVIAMLGDHLIDNVRKSLQNGYDNLRAYQDNQKYLFEQPDKKNFGQLTGVIWVEEKKTKTEKVKGENGKEKVTKTTFDREPISGSVAWGLMNGEYDAIRFNPYDNTFEFDFKTKFVKLDASYALSADELPLSQLMGAEGQGTGLSGIYKTLISLPNGSKLRTSLNSEFEKLVGNFMFGLMYDRNTFYPSMPDTSSSALENMTYSNGEMTKENLLANLLIVLEGLRESMDEGAFMSEYGAKYADRVRDYESLTGKSWDDFYSKYKGKRDDAKGE